MTKLSHDLLRYFDDNPPEARDFFYEEGLLPEDLSTDYRLIEHHGGEGQGDSYWTVYKFTDQKTGEECYLKFDGWYASYDGAEFERVFEVFPKEQTVTVWSAE